MTTLKPCPCGFVPEVLAIEAEHDRPKWAYAVCPGCGVWMIEFRAQHAEIGSDTIQKMACTAWNEGPRLNVASRKG